MKCISLFVCFFIGLQTLNVPDYERLISNIESKVEIVDESKASFLSLKCRDVTNAIQIEQADLICRIEIQSQKKDKLESKYIQKKKQELKGKAERRDYYEEVFIVVTCYDTYYVTYTWTYRLWQQQECRFRQKGIKGSI